ncbi:MAG: hypothetical protein JJW00_03885 [Sulfurimonas sp.]|nr:hypothetical protein [Sulfurimonas sp.]
MKKLNLNTTKEYESFIIDIKKQIEISQTKAITKVNQELIMMYFNIGKIISVKQEKLGWGAKVIDNLSHDIKVSFPQLDGFSTRNIKRMVRFYKEYIKVPPAAAQLSNEKMPPLVAQTPWTHIRERELTEVLPKEFESSLPTIEMIEEELKNRFEDKK